MRQRKKMVIDCHAHLFKSIEVISKKWLERMHEHKKRQLGDEGYKKWKSRMEGESPGTVEALIKDMDEAGVDISVVSPSGPFQPFPGEEHPESAVREANEYVAEAQRKFPDRIIGFVRADLWREGAAELIEEAITKWGLKGVKIHHSFLPLTDERFQKVLGKIHELEVPIWIHQGVDPIPFLVEIGNPTILDKFTVIYPKMIFNAAHYARGYGELLTAIISQREGRIFSDLALWQVEYARSRWHFYTQLRHLMDMVPYAILMGSDWPWIEGSPLTHKEWFDVIRNLKIPDAVMQLGFGIRDFSQEEKDLILGENAKRFLKIQDD
jgi:predicted TIM-barrel fold metal-dependent hydrolase